MRKNKKKIFAIIQARYNSTRFPGKILSEIENRSALEILLLRLKKSKFIDKIVVACTYNQKDKRIIEICNKLKIAVFIGSEDNVLDRYYRAANKFNAKNINKTVSATSPRIINSNSIPLISEK